MNFFQTLILRKGLIWPVIKGLLAIMMQGCIQEELEFDKIKSPDWSSQWAVPLINTEFDLYDFLKDSSTIITGEDGLVALVYENKDLISIDAYEEIQIPDQECDMHTEYPLPPLPSGTMGSVPLTLTAGFDTDEEDQRIDSAWLKGGSFRLECHSSLNKDFATAEFIIRSLIHQTTRDTLRFIMDIGNPGGLPEVMRDTTIPMSEYILVPEPDAFQNQEIHIQAIIHFMADGNPDLSPYYLKLENSFVSMDFSRIYGYLGQYSEIMEDTILLDIFKINEEGHFTFAEGSVGLKLKVRNSSGVPGRLTAERFTAFHQEGSDSADIHLIPDVFGIHHALPGQEGQYVFTEQLFESPDIHEALNISPYRLLLRLKGEMNWQGDTTVFNFVLDSSRIQADMEVELRLYGAVEGFQVSDTVSFELEPISNLGALQLNIWVSNGFPITAGVELLLVDSTWQVVHTLMQLNDPLMMAAGVGPPPGLRVESPAETLSAITIADEETLEKIYRATWAIVRVRIETPPGQLVKIYPDYKIRLRAGALVGMKP
ncbi:MAG: hypothetical protein JW861_04480 [Bacteroidales bacterium]|nr:hypothetical protein [Bacteroidales bacterium]